MPANAAVSATYPTPGYPETSCVPLGSVITPLAPNVQVLVLLPVLAMMVTSVPVPLPLMIGVSAGSVSTPSVPNVQVLVVAVVAVSI